MKSTILIVLLATLTALSVSATYYRFMVTKDYVTRAEIDCDPLHESCFVWICDPAVDGEEYCTGDPEEDTWYYKVLYRNSQHIPQCNPVEDENCTAFECDSKESDCEVITCTDTSLLSEDIDGGCTNPATFTF